MSQLYKKVNGKFVEIGPSDGWHGFPAEGIWEVVDKPGEKSSSWIRKLSDLPDPATICMFHRRKMAICRAISNYFDYKRDEWEKSKTFSYCSGDIADWIITEMVRETEEVGDKRELLIEKITFHKEEIID